MRFLLAIHNAYTDHRSGAAHSMRTMTEWLAQAGHDCRVLCTARFDGLPQAVGPHLKALGTAVTRLAPSKASGGAHCPAVRFELGGVPVTMILTRQRDEKHPDRAEGRQFLGAFEALADRFDPDLVLSYGGHPVLQAMLERAQELAIVTVFSLRNHGYENRRWFAHADHALTCSDFLSAFYRRKIGLRSTGLASPIAWSEVVAPAEGRGFVTFVNPAPHKGLMVFARLAQMLGDERPDIPLLVVQSAMDAALLAALPELDFARYPQLVASPSLSEPADIFALAKLLLVPSLFEEPFGRVAAEAMINGVPPLVSDRGALPEAVGEGGLVLPVPDWLRPETRRLPSAAEVRPWFDAIVRLWDDPAAYAQASAAARAASHRRYDETAQRQRYVDYFTSLGPGTGLFEDRADADLGAAARVP